MKELGSEAKHEGERWANNRSEDCNLSFRRRERYAAVLTHEDAAEICLRARQRPQPLQARTPPRRSPELQGTLLGRLG